MTTARRRVVTALVLLALLELLVALLTGGHPRPIVGPTYWT